MSCSITLRTLAKSETLKTLIDAAHQAREHAARAALDDVRDAHLGHLAHAAGPQHGTGGLAGQSGADFLDGLVAGDVHVGHNIDRGLIHRGAGKFFGELFGRALQQRAVERSRDGQHEGALGPGFLCQSAGALDGALVTGDHHLPGAVEVDRFDGLVLRGLLADVDHHLVGQAQDGGHAAHANGNSRLHGLRTKAHEAHGVFNRKDARGRQGRVFAQAVAGHHFGQRAALFFPSGKDGVAGGQQRGLRVDRQIQIRVGPLGNQGAQRLAERLIGAFHHGGGRRRLGDPVGHADLLRALSGENKR